MSNSLYLRLLTYVKPYWKQFAAGIVAMVVLAASETAVPAMLKPLLDGSFVEQDPVYMFWMPIVMLGVFAIRGLSHFASTMAIAWVGNKV
ncbi:MAG: lipid ABC transporter permease/ATP-binding protein, partial [Gammaproteobacteria bacterium]|nr:lipid ABC transporter permease/ATP-binding protein [Gammaproteobacteria bacterium]